MEKADFDQFLNGRFGVPIDDGTVLDLTLIAVDALKPRQQPTLFKTRVPLRENPFRLTFRGPPGKRLPDTMLPLQNPQGETHEIGISAFAEDEDGIYYDAYFN